MKWNRVTYIRVNTWWVAIDEETHVTLVLEGRNGKHARWLVRSSFKPLFKHHLQDLSIFLKGHMVIYKHGSADGFLVTYLHCWPLGMFIQEREMTPVSGGWREWVMLHLEHSHKLISEFKMGLRSKVVCSYNYTNQHGNLNCNILRGSTCRYMQTLHCLQCCRHGLNN